MNERLYELINQAFIGTTEGELSTLNTVANIEKFAELIVRECSAFANHFSDGHEKDQFERKMFHYTADIGQVILEHFGVEE